MNTQTVGLKEKYRTHENFLLKKVVENDKKNKTALERQIDFVCKEKGIDQDQLAGLLGVSSTYLSLFKKGRKGEKNAAKLKHYASVLGVSIDHLVALLLGNKPPEKVESIHSKCEFSGKCELLSAPIGKRALENLIYLAEKDPGGFAIIAGRMEERCEKNKEPPEKKESAARGHSSRIA